MNRARPRRARRADIGALVALEAHFPTDRLRRANFLHLLTRGNAHIWVCEADEQLFADAVILFRKRSRIARVYSIVVHPGHRGRGHARQLMETAEAAAAGRGCRWMHLEVRPGNLAAQALYRELGYEPSGRVEGFYEDGVAALRMTKALSVTH
jgi:ribosomal-protein-alanine N-acetyltransferase